MTYCVSRCQNSPPTWEDNEILAARLINVFQKSDKPLFDSCFPKDRHAFVE